MKGEGIMLVQIKPWGNSQGVRLPKSLLEACRIRSNDYLEAVVTDRGLLLSKTFRHRTLEERAQEYEGQLQHYEEFDWGDPVGKELW